MTVLAATAWPTNGHLIADCAQLGYLTPHGLTLDATYGRGVWWSQWRPERLVTCGAPPLIADPKDATPMLRADFRRLPFPDGTFDQIAYDPPYVCVGGRQTTGLADMHGRFGLSAAPRTPKELQGLIDHGLAQMARAVKPKGIVLAKCQDYVSSGKLWDGVARTQRAAADCGFRVVDILVMHGKVRPQPSTYKHTDRWSGEVTVRERRQVHAHRNLSTLLVLRAAR